MNTVLFRAPRWRPRRFPPSIPRSWSTGLTVALVAMLAPVAGTTGTATAAGALISQNRPVTASSTESAAAFPATAAVDGNVGTRWSSQFSDPQWIQVDLGAGATVDEVRLSWETAYGRAYAVQTSNDAVSWTTIFSTTTSTGGMQTLPVTGAGRFLRLNLTQRATQWGYSLWELQVFGTTGGGPPPPPGPAGLAVGSGLRAGCIT